MSTTEFATETVFIGTWTGNGSRGIYAYPLADRGNGRRSLLAEIDNPSYLAISHDGRMLYAVSESARGKITAYRLTDSGFVFCNDTATASAGLVHLTTDSRDRFLFTVSYEDSAIQTFRLLHDGSVGAQTCEVRHTGHGVDSIRQEKAHAHSVWLTPTERELCVCDLGIDSLVVYEVDYKNGNLARRNDRSVSFPAGSGPRHMVFHPDGNRAYVLTELSSHIFVFAWTDESGFALLQSVEMKSDAGTCSIAAAIRISGDGRFLYASNRGEDTIVVFAVQKDGLLNKVQTVSAIGKHPRDFTLSLDGKYLLCANRDTDSITRFERDGENGTLTNPTVIRDIPSPVAVLVVATFQPESARCS